MQPLPVETGAFPRGALPKPADARPVPAGGFPLFGGGGTRADAPIPKDGEVPPRPPTKKRARVATTSAPDFDAAELTAVGGGPKHAADELSFKRLRPGMVMLCRVKRVTRSKAVLSLPHGLTGVVAAEDVNEVVASGAAPAPVEDGEGDSSGGEEEGAPAGRTPLTSLLTPGQFVLAVALRVGREGSGGDGASRAIALSLAPTKVNAQVTLTTLSTRGLVWGCIRSVEDRGYVVSLGLPGGVSGFLPFDACDGTAGQAGTGRPLPARLHPGTPLFCTLTGEEAVGRALPLACTVASVTNALDSQPNHTIYSLLPGSKVRVVLGKLLPNGCAVNFLTFFHGSVHMSHLPVPATATWASGADAPDGILPTGKSVPARILWVDVVDKSIALSLAPHVLTLGGVGEDAPAPNGLGLGAPLFSAGDGAIVNATVLRVDVGSGLALGWGGEAPPPTNRKVTTGLRKLLDNRGTWGSTGYVHISRVADTHTEHVERLYSPGDSVRARVIGFSGVDGTALLTMKPSVLDAAVLRVGDVVPGAVLTGLVESVLGEADLRAGKGVIALVKLGDGVNGRVPALHASDLPPARAFPSSHARSTWLKSAGLVAGEKVKLRVLDVDGATGRISLTHKQGLVGSKLPPLSSVDGVVASLAETAAAGTALVSHGFISGLLPHGVVVTFYGGVSGMIPAADVIAAGLATPEPGAPNARVTLSVNTLSALYTIGQVVKVRVVDVDTTRRRLRLSLSTAVPAAAAAAAVEDAAPPTLPLGSFCDGVVLSHDAEHGGRLLVRVTLVMERGKPKQVVDCVVELPLVHLSDTPLGVARLAGSASVAVGTMMRGLLVVAGPPSTAGAATAPVAVVSAKRVLCGAAAASAAASPPLLLPASAEGLAVGRLVVGWVASLTDFGVFVRFLDGLTGLVPLKHSVPGVTPALGQTVACVVVSVGTEDAKRGVNGRIVLSTLPTALAAGLRRAGYLASAAAAPGKGASPPHSLASLSLQSLLGAVLGDPAPYVLGGEYAGRVAARDEAGVTVMLQPTDTTPGPSAFIRAASIRTPKGAPALVVGDAVTVRLLDVESSASGAAFAAQLVGRGNATEPPPSKKQKGGAKPAPAAPLPPADHEAVAAALPALPSTLTLGSAVSATVLLPPRKNCPYAVVGVDVGGGATRLAYAALEDLVSGGELRDVGDEGASITVVVTQLPLGAGKGKGGKSVKGSAVDGLILVSAASVLAPDAQPAAAASAGAVRPAKSPKPPSTDLLPVASLRPGAVVKARLFGASTKAEAGEKKKPAEVNESGTLPSLRFAIMGVMGPYEATLRASECVDLKTSKGKAGANALALYHELAALPGDSIVELRVVSSSADALLPPPPAAEVAKPAKGGKAGKAPKGDKPDAPPAPKDVHVSFLRLELTARPSDLALPPGSLVPGRMAVVGGVPLTLGSIGLGVVEGASADGSHLYVGLGGGISARVPALECGDDDTIRDGVTGALRCTQAACNALQHPLLLHPRGSVVPVVVTAPPDVPKPDPSGRHIRLPRVEASIRLAKGAAAVAAGKSDVAPPVAKKSRRGDAPVESPAPDAPSPVVEWLDSRDSAHILPGQLTLGRVCKPSGGEPEYGPTSTSLRVALSGLAVGRVCITQLADPAEWKNAPLASPPAVGSVIRVVVLPGSDAANLALSCRPSLLAAAAGAAADGKKRKPVVPEGVTPADRAAAAAARLEAAETAETEALCVLSAVVPGYVVSSSDKGVFVRFSRTATARVLRSALSYNFVRNVEAEFPPGALVQGKLTGGADGAWEMTLKREEVLGLPPPPPQPRMHTFNSLRPGMKVHGVVSKVAEFGVFVSLDGTDAGRKGKKAKANAPRPLISGLCHVSEVDGATGEAARGSLATLFAPGDKVECVVMGVDAEARKVSLSMKSQALAAMDAAPLEQEPEDDDASSESAPPPPPKAAKVGRPIAAVTMRDTKSRWGSCSGAGRLAFSWRLIMAPDFVLDYVIAHEVAHLREMNHGVRFWKLCASLTDADPKAARAWLKRHGGALHAYG